MTPDKALMQKLLLGVLLDGECTSTWIFTPEEMRGKTEWLALAHTPCLSQRYLGLLERNRKVYWCVTDEGKKFLQEKLS